MTAPKYKVSRKPQQWAFIRLARNICGYKKTKDAKGNATCIVKLLIPKGTLVYKGSDGCWKCRAERATVLSIQTMSGTVVPESYSLKLLDRDDVPDKKDYVACPWYYWVNPNDADVVMVYKRGKTLVPHEPFSLKQEACKPGIHFFETRLEAERYNY